MNLQDIRGFMSVPSNQTIRFYFLTTHLPCAGRHGIPGYPQGDFQVQAPYTAVMGPQRPVSMTQGLDFNPAQVYGNTYGMQHPGRPMSGGDGARYPAAYAQRYQ